MQPDPVLAAIVSTAPVSFTPDQMQAILAMSASVQAGQPGMGAPLLAVATLAVVTMAAIPQFTFVPANSITLGTSLLNMFPSINRSVLLKVTQHEFKPSNLYKLDPWHKDCTA